MRIADRMFPGATNEPDPDMTSKSPQAAAPAPRPSLASLYKPVGIGAVTAANICKTGMVKASQPKAK